jgi:hypothetical protein
MEVAKPVAFILCVVSLYALFIHAFLLPSNDMQEKICDCLSLLMLAAGNVADKRIDFPARDARNKCARRTAPGHTSCPTVLLGFEHHARSLPRFLVLGKPLHFLSRCTLLKLAASEVPL